MNKAGNKFKWTQKFDNDILQTMHFTIKLQYVKYEIYSPLPSNKTAQRNS